MCLKLKKKNFTCFHTRGSKNTRISLKPVILPRSPRSLSKIVSCQWFILRNFSNDQYREKTRWRICSLLIRGGGDDAKRTQRDDRGTRDSFVRTAGSNSRIFCIFSTTASLQGVHLRRPQDQTTCVGLQQLPAHVQHFARTEVPRDHRVQSASEVHLQLLHLPNCETKQSTEAHAMPQEKCIVVIGSLSFIRLHLSFLTNFWRPTERTFSITVIILKNRCPSTSAKLMSSMRLEKFLFNYVTRGFYIFHSNIRHCMATSEIWVSRLR